MAPGSHQAGGHRFHTAMTAIGRRAHTTAHLSAAGERHWLRRLAAWAPPTFIALLLIMLLLQHPHNRLAIGIHLVVLGVVIAGSLTFSRFVFSRIAAQEAAIFRQNRDLAATHAVARILSESRDLEGVLPHILDSVLEATGADAGEIFLVEEGSGDLVMKVQRGPHPDAFREITRFKPGMGVPGFVAQTREPIVVRDLAREPRFLRRKLTEAGFRAFVSVPLKAKDQVVGVMSAAARDAARLGEAEVQLLVALGNQIGLAVENARVAGKLPALAVLEERQRIARELHDSLAQTLAYIQMKLASARRKLGDTSAPGAGPELESLEATARKAYAEIRQAIFGLRTMVSRDLGFVPTLTEYLAEVSRQTGLAIDLKVGDDRATRFSLNAEVQIIRIIQEALANVMKHAAATRVQVVFECGDGTTRLVVEDNGAGFDPAEPRGRQAFGLETMRERAELIGGRFAITSAPGAGARVEVRLPLESPEGGGT